MCSKVTSGELGSWCIIHFGTVKRLQIRAGGRQKEGGRGTDHAFEWRKKKIAKVEGRSFYQHGDKKWEKTGKEGNRL